VGLPASGKSTYSTTLKNENTVVLSTDDIREKMFGYHFSDEIKGEVFCEMFEQTLTHLQNEKKVVLDTTYLNDENSRCAFLEKVKICVKGVYAKLIYFDTDVASCVLRDNEREAHRRVGEKIIQTLHTQLSIADPDGWLDEICTIGETYEKGIPLDPHCVG
jgi:predicted kinase